MGARRHGGTGGGGGDERVSDAREGSEERGLRRTDVCLCVAVALVGDRPALVAAHERVVGKRVSWRAAGGLGCRRPRLRLGVCAGAGPSSSRVRIELRGRGQGKGRTTRLAGVVHASAATRTVRSRIEPWREDTAGFTCAGNAVATKNRAVDAAGRSGAGMGRDTAEGDARERTRGGRSAKSAEQSQGVAYLSVLLAKP
jgi:hypothetical protein